MWIEELWEYEYWLLLSAVIKWDIKEIISVFYFTIEFDVVWVFVAFIMIE